MFHLLIPGFNSSPAGTNISLRIPSSAERSYPGIQLSRQLFYLHPLPEQAGAE
jgi:hypothetical protein